MQAPTTLGEKLAIAGGQRPRGDGAASARSFLLGGFNVVVVTMATLLPLVWLVQRPGDPTGLIVVGMVLLGMWGVSKWLGRPRRIKPPALHFLLADDPQGFMPDLRLDSKTAVLDGSNLYHFGLGENMGARALRLIAGQLRREGYRVVCFFDANIFYTLIKNRAIEKGPAHTTYLLTQVFGLDYSEIYVVPSGVQADKYVLSTLKHLPTSFAVTNDQFRDYGKMYADVMTGGQWRKGVVIKGNELRLHQFRFQTPIRLNAG